MELADYLRILRNHWRAVVAAVLAFALLAFVYSAMQPKVYQATSSGFVTSGTGGDPALDNLNDTLSKSRAASYVALAQDRNTAELVIEDLNLDTTPQALVGNITAAQTPDTVIITISATAGSPSDARDLADAWVAALAQRVDDIEAGKGGSGPNSGMRIEVSESAQLPTEPISPNVTRNVLLGAILGGLIGMAYSVARSMLDRRIRTEDDISRAADVSSVGAVPDVGGQEGLFVTASGVGNAALAAEAIRRLRTNLNYMDVDNPPRAIVVTSPKQGDGKSTLAANLAAAIALSGQPVTLIDGDLRRPRVAPMLEVDDSVGLTDVLTHRLDLDDALQMHHRIPNLSILTAGAKPPNPSEILASRAMQSVITELCGRGMVIIDAPPLLPVTDGAILAQASDGAIITVGAGKTLDTDLAAAVEHLHKVNARALGAVLNRVSKRSVGAAYFAQYGSHYTEYVEDDVIEAATNRRPAKGGRRAAR